MWSTARRSVVSSVQLPTWNYCAAASDGRRTELRKAAASVAAKCGSCYRHHFHHHLPRLRCCRLNSRSCLCCSYYCYCCWCRCYHMKQWCRFCCGCENAAAVAAVACDAAVDWTWLGKAAETRCTSPGNWIACPKCDAWNLKINKTRSPCDTDGQQ